MIVVRWVVVGLLVVFLCRRYVLLVASFLPRRRSGRDTTRTITILVAGRNEGGNIPRMLAAIERLDYPAERVHVVLASDGSSDNTADLMSSWAAARERTTVLALPESLGKGGALSAALAVAPPSDLVVVLDADCVPDPLVLQILSGVFDDPRVGAATGYPYPGNANATLVSRYAALERWTHHLVVLAGKDRLGLDPSIIGVVFAIRREALHAAGGFPVGRFSEDIDLSMSVLALGWKLRWVRGAQVREDVVEDMDRFFQQRTRWGRGILQSASGAKSVESFFVVAGYLDRVVLLVAVVLVLVRQLHAWLPMAYLVAPAMTALTALHRAKGRPVIAFVWSAILMLAADLAVSAGSTFGQLFGTKVKWGQRS